MYKFEYDVMQPKYGNNISLFNSDTDSLFYQIKTEEFYSDMHSNEWIDYLTHLSTQNSFYKKTNYNPKNICFLETIMLQD